MFKWGRARVRKKERKADESKYKIQKNVRNEDGKKKRKCLDSRDKSHHWYNVSVSK